jgi:hypothetical protein
MSKADQQLLELARKRFKAAAEAEQHIRDEALQDFEFRIGDQWPDGVKLQREQDGRPALTINRIPQFLRQVTNEQRLSRPSVQVNAVDSGADVETAEIYQGLTRHIEVSSDAEAAYDTAFECATTGGFGWLRILTEYCDDESFDQDIRIERVLNPFSVYVDPAAVKPDRSDMNWAFVVEDFSADEYRALFPDSQAAGLSDWSSIGDAAPDWHSGGNIRVAEYFRVETQRRELLLMVDGSTVFADEFTGAIPEAAVLQRRPVQRRQIKWAKINGVEVLQQRDWAGKWIPLVPVLGDEVSVNGQRHLFGMVRFARDPQRMYNYWVSSATETIALAPRAPFIGVEGQFEGHENQWRLANVRSFAYLEYKPTSVGGQPAPPPQRNFAEPPIQAIMASIGQADNDLKATMGIYDASLGQRGPESSGRAILARQRESDTANANFGDNLARAIKHVGRILIDLIPKIYHSERVVRILRPDGSSDVVPVNQSFVDKGVQRIYDLGAGKYDVTISTGPSYQTQRQEAAASMIDLAKVEPRLMQVAGDIVVGNMDWPGAPEIAARLKKLLPPELQDAGENGTQELPPEAQAQVAAMGQQIQQLRAALDESMRALETKQIEADNRLQVAREQSESRERIAEMQRETQLILNAAKIESQEAQAAIKAQLEELKMLVAAMRRSPDPQVSA